MTPFRPHTEMAPMRLRRRSVLRVLLLASSALLVAGPTGLAAQGVKIAVGDVGLGLGPVPRLDGLRLNVRDDDRLRLVRGVNVTLWSPETGVRGRVVGLALGLPLTGARDVRGVGLGGGVGAEEAFHGVGLGLVGAGAGRDLVGIFVGGLGAGAGGRVRGLAVGGLGVGAGESVDGIAVGGLGAGSGGDVRGVLAGGLGVGAGGDATGLLFGGLGVGAGGNARGVLVGGLGVGAGGDVTGLAVAGLGVGSGGHLKGVALAGGGVGASRITGLAAASVVGAVDVHGVVLAPAYVRIEEEGRLRGLSVSAVNHVRGSQHGLAIGLVNIARELHGVQVGLLNIAWNARFPVLPLVNAHFD